MSYISYMNRATTPISIHSTKIGSFWMKDFILMLEIEFYTGVSVGH